MTRQPSGRRTRAENAKTNERCRLYEAYLVERQRDPQGSQEVLARRIGTSGATLSRILRDVKAGEAEGRTPEESLGAKYTNAGRKSRWSYLLNIAEVCEELKLCYVSTLRASSEAASIRRGRTGVQAATMRLFAGDVDEKGLCPEAFRIEIFQSRGERIPADFARFFRRITPEVEALIRGNKHAAHNGIVSRRDMTARLPNGDRLQLVAGFEVEFDDMSSNHPFFGIFEDGTWGLSRQGLYARDVKTGFRFPPLLVVRPREAYRAEDILRYVEMLMRRFGKFRKLRFEKGIWRAKAITGITPTGEEETFERPGMAEEDQTRLQDGLNAIGVSVSFEVIDYAHKSGQKGGVEQSFDDLQKVQPRFMQEFVNVGRYGGEFELPAKRLRQARYKSGNFHPEALGFAPVDVAAERIGKAIDFLNQQKTTWGTIPAEDWARDLEQWPLPELTERDTAAFLPHVRRTKIQGGAIFLKRDKAQRTPHEYRHDIFAKLGRGFEVTIRWDADNPQRGIAVYNRAGRLNPHGFGPDEFICQAAWVMPGPQCEITEVPEGMEELVQPTEAIYGVPSLEDDGYSRKRRQEKALRAEAKQLPRPGQPPRQGSGQAPRQGSGQAPLQRGSGEVSRKDAKTQRGTGPDGATNLSGSRSGRAAAEAVQDRRELAEQRRKMADLRERLAALDAEET